MPASRVAAVAVLALLAFAPAAHAQSWPDPEPLPAEELPLPTEETPAEPLPGEALPLPLPGEPLPLPPEDPVPQEPPAPVVELVRTAMVPGVIAKLRTDGKAAIPRGAPKVVRTLIAAMNRIVGKPYRYGGGHARILDRAYDCSGAVSYGLIGAGMLRAPVVSGTLTRFGAAGPGRWITTYANKGHVYLEVAGLRLDTSAVGDTYGGRSGVRWRSLIGKRRGFVTRHPVGF
jgi:hypothetical protein